MKATLRKMGNSQGVLIPKAIIAQLGIEDDLEMVVEDNAIVLRLPPKNPRAGWDKASQRIASINDDHLVLPEFANESDAELVW